MLFSSFQSGYLKRLDWDLYCRLGDPVAKRLYRFLDKRFYRRDELVFDLDDLAFNKVRVSRNYDSAQAQRALLAGISELERLWELKAMEPQERFRRVARGKWEVVFVRKAKRKRSGEKTPAGVEKELIERKIGRAVARELVGTHAEEKIRSMIRLFDWHNGRGEKKGPGYLVAAIRDAQGYVLPAELAGRPQTALQESRNSRKPVPREFQRPERERHANPREEAFWGFWVGLKKAEQEAFEDAAVREADATKRSGYLRTKPAAGPLFEQYRLIILREHFQRASTSGSTRIPESDVAAAATGSPIPLT